MTRPHASSRLVQGEHRLSAADQHVMSRVSALCTLRYGQARWRSVFLAPRGRTRPRRSIGLISITWRRAAGRHANQNCFGRPVRADGDKASQDLASSVWSRPGAPAPYARRASLQVVHPTSKTARARFGAGVAEIPSPRSRNANSCLISQGAVDHSKCKGCPRLAWARATDSLSSTRGRARGRNHIPVPARWFCSGVRVKSAPLLDAFRESENWASSGDLNVAAPPPDA